VKDRERERERESRDVIIHQRTRRPEHAQSVRDNLSVIMLHCFQQIFSSFLSYPIHLKGFLFLYAYSL